MNQTQSEFKVHPFTRSTQDIPFGEWVTILTVTLAPLIAHIAAGTPHPSILTKQDSRLPKWHDTICLYNPTSILWRYAAIADRRIRAKDWSVADMAATNAIFWTGTPKKKRKNTTTGEATVGVEGGSEEKTPQQQSQDLEHTQPKDDPCEEGGWNGTEEMILASLPYCIELPLHARAELFSWETIKTIIITLQGLQTIFILASGLGKATDGLSDGVDIVFTAFTLLGLFRLCAAGYLTSTGFAYTARDDISMDSAPRMVDPYVRAAESGGDSGKQATTTTQMHRGEYTYSGIGGHHHIQHDSYDSIIHGATILNNNQRRPTMAGIARYHSTNYIPSVLFRYTYMIFLIFVWAISLVRCTPIPKILNIGGNKNVPWEKSITTLLSGGFYVFFMSCTCALIGVYFWRGGTRSTMMPCVGKVWYKIYTVIVFAWMVTTFVVACGETSRLPCGRYTSTGEVYWNGRTDCKTVSRTPVF